MKRKTSAKRPRASRLPSEAQLKALRTSTTTRRQATIERLRSAIDALTARKAKITAQAIYEECGLRYAAIHRNQEALALFRSHSTHLVERFHAAQQQVQELRQQLAVTVDAGMKREARIAELEARLAKLEPYRAFIEQWRTQMQREERGRFGDLPEV